MNRQIFVVVFSIAIVAIAGCTLIKHNNSVNTMSAAKPYYIREKDGMKMILIPEGKFSMGDHHNIKRAKDEKPVHDVYLDAYYIDEHEVTNAQYCKFLNENSNDEDSIIGFIGLDYNDCLIEKSDGIYRPKPGYENYPVIYVSWDGAEAYAKWVGGRLPTEAEWEKAARGGLSKKKYPWGNSEDNKMANYNFDGSRGWSTEDMLKYLKPVRSYPANNYGLYDMAGNVSEWCADWYDKYNSSPSRNPKGPSIGDWKILRGGSWLSDQNSIRCANRDMNVPVDMKFTIGFRCVR